MLSKVVKALNCKFTPIYIGVNLFRFNNLILLIMRNEDNFMALLSLVRLYNGSVNERLSTCYEEYDLIFHTIRERDLFLEQNLWIQKMYSVTNWTNKPKLCLTLLEG